MNALDLALTIFNNNWVRAILGLIGANVLFGISLALFTRKYTFYLGDLADFLQTRVIPYLFGYGALKLVVITALVEYQQAAEVAMGAVSAAIMAALLGKILGQFKTLFPDLPIPQWATTMPKPEVRGTP
jgi:hypothetical protein